MESCIVNIDKQKAQQLDQQISKQEEEKQSSVIQGINKSFTLVKNTKMNTLDKVPDLSPHWVETPGRFVPFLPQNNGDDDTSSTSTKPSLSITDETIELLNVDFSNLLKQVAVSLYI